MGHSPQKAQMSHAIPVQCPTKQYGGVLCGNLKEWTTMAEGEPNNGYCSSSGEEDGDAAWKAAINSVAGTSSYISSFVNGLPATKHTDPKTKTHQIKHYQLKVLPSISLFSVHGFVRICFSWKLKLLIKIQFLKKIRIFASIVYTLITYTQNAKYSFDYQVHIFFQVEIHFGFWGGSNSDRVACFVHVCMCFFCSKLLFIIRFWLGLLLCNSWVRIMWCCTRAPFFLIFLFWWFMLWMFHDRHKKFWMTYWKTV